MTERETKFYEKLILKEMARLLTHMPGHSGQILDLESGREYLCSVCDVPLKPCAIHPGSLCCVALKGGTELFELEAALIRLHNDEYGICIRCGKKIAKQHLKNHPAAVLCEQCLQKASSTKSKSTTGLRSQENRKI